METDVGTSEVKRENSDLCETKNMIKRRSEFKKNSRASPGLQLKDFSLKKQKLDLEWTINGLEKPFRKVFKNLEKHKNAENFRM